MSKHRRNTQGIQVRLTPDEMAVLRREAARRGLTLAGCMRYALAALSRREADVDGRLAERIAGLAATLGALATRDDVRAAVRALAAAMVDVRRLPAITDVLDELEEGRTERDAVAEAAVRAYEAARGAVPLAAEEDEG